MLIDLTTFTLIYLACGTIVWMLASDGLLAEVRLRRLMRGRQPKAWPHVLVGCAVVVGWPLSGCKFVLRGRVL